jgi:hypothetical protein
MSQQSSYRGEVQAGSREIVQIMGRAIRKGPHNELSLASMACLANHVDHSLTTSRPVSVEADNEPPALDPNPPVADTTTSPDAMFTLAFHERYSEEYWSVATIPFQVPSYKEERMVLRASADQIIMECRIPSSGRLYIVGAGGIVVHTIDYTIPSVRSKIMDQITRPNTTSGPQIGLVRTEELSLDEFPGYDELPPVRWIQLNPSTDEYVVQIKVLKVKPVDRYRSISRGNYFIYTPTSIVLRPPVAQPAATAEIFAPGDAAVRAMATVVGITTGPEGAKYGNTDINSVRDL